MTLIRAHWMRHRVSSKEIYASLEENGFGKPCFGFGKYLGSMMYFDFGVGIGAKDYFGNQILKGEFIISIYDCRWDFTGKKGLLVTSDSVDDESANEIKSDILGCSLVDFTAEKKKNIKFIFSNDSIIEVDITGDYDGGDELIGFTFLDGKKYIVSPRGYFYISDLISKEHYKSVACNPRMED